jgi:sensor domain CHASE-containing protein
MDNLYLVMALKKEHEAQLVIGPAKEITVPLTLSWAHGMVGCLPVFNDKAAAVRYAGKKHAVMMVAEVYTSMVEEDPDGPE